VVRITQALRVFAGAMYPHAEVLNAGAADRAQGETRVFFDVGFGNKV
jgi:hypothetical protein